MRRRMDIDTDIVLTIELAQAAIDAATEHLLNTSYSLAVVALDTARQRAAKLVDLRVELEDAEAHEQLVNESVAVTARGIAGAQ